MKRSPHRSLPARVGVCWASIRQAGAGAGPGSCSACHGTRPLRDRSPSLDLTMRRTPRSDSPPRGVPASDPSPTEGVEASKPAAVEARAEVAVAAVGKDHDNDALGGAPGDLAGGV